MRRIVTLTTDFGVSDNFIGVMKGVILNIAPDAAIVDLTHGIPPQNVIAGALALESAVDFFPRGAIHVGVVDPGVGTDRRPIALSTERAIYVGPDNGLFDLALRRTPLRQAVHLTNTSMFRSPVSATFHGRDIFASVGGHLVAGVPFRSLGDPIDTLVKLDIPEPMYEADALRLQVIAADRFGNLVTNLERARLESWAAEPNNVVVHIRGREVRIHRTYADVGPGDLVAYVGSGGRLEIGVNGGSALEALGAVIGDDVILRRGGLFPANLP